MAAVAAMVAIGVTKMALEGLAGAQKGINEARRIKAQNKARIRQMQNQFDLSTQNLHNNNVSIKQNKMKNDVRIEENKLDAQDAFSQAFIGSGISGRTVDAMEADMMSDVDKAHTEAGQIAKQETDRQFLGLMRQSSKITEQLNNMESFDFNAMESNMNMAMLKSGLDSAGSMAASGAFDGFGGAPVDNGTTGTQSFKNTKFTNTFSGNTRGSSRGMS
jgi:hypothetical protein